jgi:hypothetical protein
MTGSGDVPLAWQLNKTPDLVYKVRARLDTQVISCFAAQGRAWFDYDGSPFSGFPPT